MSRCPVTLNEARLAKGRKRGLAEELHVLLSVTLSVELNRKDGFCTGH